MAATAVFVAMCSSLISLRGTPHLAQRSAATMRARAAVRAGSDAPATSAAANSSNSTAAKVYVFDADLDVAPASLVWQFRRTARRKNLLGIRTIRDAPDTTRRPTVAIVALAIIGLSSSLDLFFALSRQWLPQTWLDPAADREEASSTRPDRRGRSSNRRHK